MEDNFLFQLILMTVVMGVIGNMLLKSEIILFGFIGSMLLLGAVGGLLVSGFMMAIMVWVYVSKASSELLAIIVAAPFILGPIWFIYWIGTNRRKERDGRGFDDGDESN